MFFAGLHERTTMPEAWAEYLGIPTGAKRPTTDDSVALTEAVKTLAREYNVEERPVAFKNSESQSWEGTGRAIALVNPAWEDDPDENAVWDVPTSAYTSAGPNDIYGPLTAVLSRLEATDVFGQIRLYRHGGEMQIDLFIPTTTVETEEGTELTLGLSTGHDYFRGTTHYAEIISFNHEINSVMRGLTDRRKRKHTGESDSDVAEWWGDTIGMMDEVSDTLFGVIANAREYEIDIADIPVDGTEFFDHLGLPRGRGDGDYLAGAAAENARLTPSNPRSGYELYKAGVRAIEDEFDGKTGAAAFNSHLQAVNRLLFEPPGAEDAVLAEVQREYEGVGSLDDGENTAVETIRERRDTIQEGVEFFESHRERLRTMLSELDADDSETDEADRDGDGEGGDDGQTSDSDTTADAETTAEA